MTKSVGVHEAKTHLSRLLQAVENGEEVEITKRGQVVARLVPPVPQRRVFGLDEGRIWISDDFDELPEELREFFE